MPALRTRPAADLGPQLWVTAIAARPIPEALQPWRNPRIPSVGHKPDGGLWTSTYQPDGDDPSDWVGWCRGNDYGGVEVERFWLLTPGSGTVLEIAEYDDLAALMTAYPHPCVLPSGEHLEHLDSFDFEAMAADGYAGLHLTEDAQRGLWHSYPLNLCGWDCESTVWSRWAFGAVQLVRDFPAVTVS